MRPSFGCARGGEASAEITEALGLPLRPKTEQGTNPVKELVPGAVWLPPCESLRSSARVRHKQERQGKYPAAFVYGSRSQT